MSDKTGIEWTDATWNPTKGCDRVSPGCDNCYAMTQAVRMKAMGSPGYQLDGDPRTSGPGFLSHEWPSALDQPLRWAKPRRIFVNSMSDLFHDNISDDYIARVFAVMALAPQHQFQILTKRHGRMRSLLSGEYPGQIMHQLLDYPLFGNLGRWPVPEGGLSWPLANVWGGVSVENDKWQIRIDALRETPYAIKFLSLEPLLGPLPTLDLFGIDWVIVGGESGHGARPMHPDWARQIRDQCNDAGVAFLFKQWGSHDARGVPMDKHVAGRVLDGRTWDEYPVAL